MRIGELAALVGVSPRTVRHYHDRGLLPPAERLSNGYREYRLTDAVLLARVRRLVELGLSLDETRDVLAADRGRDLRELLLELDADLARQQDAIAERREHLATMLSAADLHPDSAVSPEMAQVLRGLPSGGSRFAELDRGLLAMLDGTADPAARAELVELFRPLTTPEAVARSQDLYRRMDELVDAEPDDPRVAPLAADLAAHLPERMAAVMVENLAAGAGRWVTEMAEELSAAQAEVFRSMVIQLKERS
jgi:DNA-binding transcriptional MerR regulator